MVAVYAPSINSEWVSFLQQLAPFLDNMHRIVFVVDWNAILDRKIDRVGRGVRGSGRYESSLINLMARHDLVDRFCLNHPRREMWTWLDSSPSVHARSYLDRVLEELTPILLRVQRSTI